MFRGVPVSSLGVSRTVSRCGSSRCSEHPLKQGHVVQSMAICSSFLSNTFHAVLSDPLSLCLRAQAPKTVQVLGKYPPMSTFLAPPFPPAQYTPIYRGGYLRCGCASLGEPKPRHSSPPLPVRLPHDRQGLAFPGLPPAVQTLWHVPMCGEDDGWCCPCLSTLTPQSQPGQPLHNLAEILPTEVDSTPLSYSAQLEAAAKLSLTWAMLASGSRLGRPICHHKNGNFCQYR